MICIDLNPYDIFQAYIEKTDFRPAQKITPYYPVENIKSTIFADFFSFFPLGKTAPVADPACSAALINK